MKIDTKVEGLPLVGINSNESLQRVLRAVNKFYEIEDGGENYLGHLSVISDCGGTWVLGNVDKPKAVAEIAFFSDIDNFIADSSMFGYHMSRDTGYKLFKEFRELELNSKTLREFDVFRDIENKGIAEILIHDMTDNVGIGELGSKLGVNYFTLPFNFIESSGYFPDPHTTIVMLRKLDDVLKGRLLVSSTFANDTDFDREVCLRHTGYVHQFNYGNNNSAFKLYAKQN